MHKAAFASYGKFFSILLCCDGLLLEMEMKKLGEPITKQNSYMPRALHDGPHQQVLHRTPTELIANHMPIMLHEWVAAIRLPEGFTSFN